MVKKIGGNFLWDTVEGAVGAIGDAMASAKREHNLKVLERKAPGYVEAFLSEQGDAVSDYVLEQFERHDFRADGRFECRFAGNAHGGMKLGRRVFIGS